MRKSESCFLLGCIQVARVEQRLGNAVASSRLPHLDVWLRPWSPLQEFLAKLLPEPSTLQRRSVTKRPLEEVIAARDPQPQVIQRNAKELDPRRRLSRSRCANQEDVD